MRCPVIATTGRWPGGRLLRLVAGVLLGTSALLAVGRWQERTPFPGSERDGEDGQRARELEQQREAIIRRTKRKALVAQAVLAGRLSLLEAAAYFRALELEPPTFHWTAYRSIWPGGTDAERHCHEVIHYACSAGTEAACDRLRAELAEHLRRGPL